MSKHSDAASEPPAFSDAGSHARAPDLSLLGASPRSTLETMKLASVSGRQDIVPTPFGDLTLVRDQISRNKPDLTTIDATGTGKKVDVTIKRDESGRPAFVRDHMGQWKSEDGGKTWKTGEPTFLVRRGEVGIDSRGRYSFDNEDYGVKSTFSPDGTSTRSMRTANGAELSVTRDARGVPTGFRDRSGEWRGDGRNWTNSRTGETRTGSVNLTEYGEFKFKSAKGETVEKTEQLERIQALQKNLTDQYGIEFGKPGEKGRENRTEMHMAGVPTEAELKVLGDVLDKTSHENYRGMKIWFVRSDTYEDKELYGHYGNESGKGPGHGCSGGCSHNEGKVAHAGGEMVIMPKARQTLHGAEGLEGTLLHELSHHEQGQRFGHDNEWGGKGSTRASRAEAGDLGWTWSKKHGAFLLKDREGGLWRRSEDEKWRWTAGKRPEDGKRLLESEDMQKRALVRPATDYFPYPYEHQSEGLTLFRIGVGESADGKDRRELARLSPELYGKIKRFDQESIDRGSGKTVTGEPEMIRGLNGRLVENTPANRRLVEEAERSWGIH